MAFPENMHLIERTLTDSRIIGAVRSHETLILAQLLRGHGTTGRLL